MSNASLQCTMSFIFRASLFLRAHLILVGIIVLATSLRVVALPTHTILFSDAGHDLLRAEAAYNTHQLPLTGIASSRPYLHQGPLSTWISMAVIAVFGTDTLAQSLTFVFISIGAVVAIYELTVTQLDRWTAYTGAALLSVFPLAVTHARMPYHTTLIPLATVFFIWAVTHFTQKQTMKTVFYLLLASLMLVGTELSNTPLLILVGLPYLRKYAPHHFSAFSVTTLPEKIITNLFNTPQTLLTLHSYTARIFAPNYSWFALVPYATIVGVLGMTLYKQKKLPLVITVTLLTGLILIAAYCANGEVSEAYIPPFFIIFALLFAYALRLLSTKKTKRIITTAVVCYCLFAAYSGLQNNFYTGSGTNAYMTTGELTEIAHTLAVFTEGEPYQLQTLSGIEKRQASYFDNLRWIQTAKNLPQAGETGSIFYLVPLSEREPKNALLLQTFSTQKLYTVTSQL